MDKDNADFFSFGENLGKMKLDFTDIGPLKRNHPANAHSLTPAAALYQDASNWCILSHAM